VLSEDNGHLWVWQGDQWVDVGTIRGPQGLQGAQGSSNQGIQGPQGAQGPQGPQGLQGSQGLQGDQGVQGTQGTQGTQGLQGDQGVQGLQGLQGLQGTQGLQGYQGVQGLQGTQGTQGLQGNQGLQGTQGVQGSDRGPEVPNVLYVTKDGNDSNTGRRLGDAKATISGAVGAAGSGTVIKVSAGSYIENNPITLPDQVSIVGDNLREVSITPQNQGDLFYVGNGNYVTGVSFVGPPNTGAIFSFDPNSPRYIEQSPYIQNCTNFIQNSIGLKIDGKSAIGPLRSMVLDSYTQYNQGGIGVSITNEGYAQLVSLFTICNDIAVYCGSGAACDLTNSNASFGNYGLVADGVGPLKYVGIISSPKGAISDEFIVDLNQPSLSISYAKYDNITGILTAYTNGSHSFSVGMGITLSGLAFTCTSGPGIVTYPSGRFGYIFEVDTVAPGRYIDSYNLIQANKSEIQVKSLASIALDHPNFVFPGDPASSEKYRYYDSYRLIQKNKQEIIDKSLASIAVGFPSGFSFPDDPYPYERNRYYDASGLIQRNKSVIVDSAWNDTAATYPSISGTATTCKRDLGFFIDAIATDVFTGGNRYSREFSNQYINGAGAGSLSGEEQETIYAFHRARDYMKQAITNTLVGAAYSNLNISTGTSTYGGGGPIYANTDPGACFDVQSNINNLVGIVTVVIGAGNTSSLSTFNDNLGISTSNICARDLGYLVDAVSIDVFTGGNKYSRDFTNFYFSGATPIGIGTSERIQSVYAFNSLRDYSKKAITNQLNYKEVGISSGPATYGGPGIAITVYPSGNPDSCTDVQSNIDTLVGIVTTVIGEGDQSYLLEFSENSGSFLSSGNKCFRDIGYLIDSLSLDVRDYTNKNVIEFIKKYFDANGNPLINGITGEVSESTTAFNSVGTYAKKAITNQLNYQDLTIAGDPTNKDPNSCANVQSFIDNLISTVTSTSVGIGTSILNTPSVSMASTMFSCNVGVSTISHTYYGGGTAQINVVRPFDGQVVFFNDLYYSIGKISVDDGGSGYGDNAFVTIDPPSTSWGIPAQAVAEVKNGSVVNIEMISNGRGYTTLPRVTISAPNSGINTAKATALPIPSYFAIEKSTPVSSGICTITLTDFVPYEVGIGTQVYFYKQSRVLASGHSLEYIGSGTEISRAVPANGGVPIQANETDSRNGGLVVFTTTDQTGNFRIGDGVVINQQTGTISGIFYAKSLFSTMTPFILALGGD
jgi:hypothetical protein